MNQVNYGFSHPFREFADYSDLQAKQKHKRKLMSNTVGDAISMRPEGITLMALVITIIVLLILAGVALNMIMGENGIFSKANKAKEETEYSQELDSLKLAILEAKAENTEASYKELLDVLKNDKNYKYIIQLEKKLADIDDTSPIKDIADISKETEIIYVIPKDYEFGIDKKLNIIEPENKIKYKSSSVEKELSKSDENNNDIELFKTKISEAITRAGIQTSRNESAEQMSQKIISLSSNSTSCFKTITPKNEIVKIYNAELDNININNNKLDVTVKVQPAGGYEGFTLPIENLEVDKDYVLYLSFKEEGYGYWYGYQHGLEISDSIPNSFNRSEMIGFERGEEFNKYKLFFTATESTMYANFLLGDANGSEGNAIIKDMFVLEIPEL